MTLRKLIQGRFGFSGEVFTKQDIRALIRENRSTYSDGYVSFMLQNMLSDGDLLRSARGLYKFPRSKRNVFTTHPDVSLKGLHKSLMEKFPFVEFCLWDARDLLPLMHHIPNVQMKIVSCPKDTVESVSHALANLTDNIVLPSPNRYTLDNVAFGRDVIVVLPLVSQAPSQIVEGIPSPKLEKVLVDILCEEPFYYLRGSETYSIYQTALKDYELKKQTMMRYAGRRNRLAEVESILTEIKQ